MKKDHKELFCQWLETEQGGVEIYETALLCVVNKDLKAGMGEISRPDPRHVEIVTRPLTDLGLDPAEETPGRPSFAISRNRRQGNGDGAPAMRRPRLHKRSPPSVVLAETKDHLNWHLIGELAKKEKGETAKILRAAFDEVEDQEDEHLYHSQGWTRELWIDSLGMPAVLPPPEEEKDVKTAIGAARAEQARAQLL